MNTLGLISIIVALALLILLVYRGLHVLVAAPIAALIVIAFNGLGIVEGYRDIYMGGVGKFVVGNLPIYLWGAIFGELYNVSGAAKAIAQFIVKIFKGKRKTAGVTTSILIVMVAGVLMSYGGISGIVLMFVLMPMTLEILKESRIPRKMAPGILLGSIATAALCMPGSPQIQNAMPMTYLNTPSTAALIPGIIGGLAVLSLNLFYLRYEAKKELANGCFYEESEDAEKANQKAVTNLPNPVLAFLPLILTFTLFNAFKLYIGYSIIAGILLGFVLFYRQVGGKEFYAKLIGKGAIAASSLCFASGALAGFGSVVSSTETFGQLAASLASLPGPPLLIAMLAFMVVTAICGSGPAAMGAGLPMFSETFAAMGVNFSALHRVASFCGTTFDTLPSNAGFIAATGLAKAPANKSYKYVGVCTVLNTTIATLVVTFLLIAFPGLA